jgi:Flp pilus assembly protein TadG
MTPLLSLHRVRDSRGQSILEMTLVLPFMLMLALGVVEISFGMLDQHIVTKLAREGSNLISRNTSLQDASTAMRAMSARPVDFDTHSKVIFSVLKKGATTGSANYNQVFLYQRFEYGALSASSKLTTSGGTFGGPPDYQANNSDNSTGLQVTNVSDDLITARGGMIYVTEVFTRHQLLTPLASWGLRVPTTLYSVAYF